MIIEVISARRAGEEKWKWRAHVKEFGRPIRATLEPPIWRRYKSSAGACRAGEKVVRDLFPDADIRVHWPPKTKAKQ
jgi:hypothetical protein